MSQPVLNVVMDDAELPQALGQIQGLFPGSGIIVEFNDNPTIAFECESAVPVSILTSLVEIVAAEDRRLVLAPKLKFDFRASGILEAIDIVASNYGAMVFLEGDSRVIVRPQSSMFRLLEFSKDADAALRHASLAGFFMKRYDIEGRIFLLVRFDNSALIKHRVRNQARHLSEEADSELPARAPSKAGEASEPSEPTKAR